MVPVQRIELPTFGLQNRCSTAELNRRIEAIGGSKVSRPLVRSSAARISDLVAKGQNLKNRFDRSRMEKAAFPAAFSERDSRTALLAEMPPAVLAAEQGAGDADKPVAAGVILAAERIGGNRRRRADRTADDAGRDIGGPEAAVVVSAIVAVLPGAIPIGLIADRPDAGSCRCRDFPVPGSGNWRLDSTARSSRDCRRLPAPRRGLRARTQGSLQWREFRIWSLVDSISGCQR